MSCFLLSTIWYCWRFIQIPISICTRNPFLTNSVRHLSSDSRSTVARKAAFLSLPAPRKHLKHCICVRSSAKGMCWHEIWQRHRGCVWPGHTQKEKACTLIDNNVCRCDQHMEAQAAFGKWGSNTEEETGFPRASCAPGGGNHASSQMGGSYSS